ncbi:MAG: WecB/TagA/CpsF family glycosyltransferase [Elusimicrobia bacterium]|nr:WecB/TagA/CpsF family glycosyltransferase [Elusimicrobiota bacterium]
MDAIRLQWPVEIDNLWTHSWAGALERLIQLCDSPTPKICCSINALTLYWMRRDHEFSTAIKTCDLATADGASLVLAGPLWGIPIKERAPGIDLAGGLLDFSQGQGWGVTAIGPRPVVLEKLKNFLHQTRPGLYISTELWSGRPDCAEKIGQRLRRRGDRLALIGLPMPLQEVWLRRNKETLGAPLLMGIGGGLEILSGQARRAPQIWQKIHAEWLYRFLQEPGRRWKSTWRSTVLFGLQCLRWEIDKMTSG